MCRRRRPAEFGRLFPEAPTDRLKGAGPTRKHRSLAVQLRDPALIPLLRIWKEILFG
ncbi:hypothetical protein BCAR13_790049 [Paraburkholderia caribensis]|nr:hypothetical protein BCAR13_790049 [Paraburkholderia caribensis]